MLHTSIGIVLDLGIVIASGQYCWILGVFLGIVLTLVNKEVSQFLSLKSPGDNECQ